MTIEEKNYSLFNKDDCKPFLRWAGGKRWFTKHLHNIIKSSEYKYYHEPFLGGGAVFLYLQPNNISFLSDMNRELIDTYTQVQCDVEEIIKHLRTFKNTKEYYYKIRESNFRTDAKKAARFIYLNQTSFNGIYRVNLKGKYNVPYGYRKKDFFEPDNLRAVSKILQNAKLSSGDFKLSLSRINKGDLVFLDPPYTVTHNNNGFIKYNSKLFDEESQIRLSNYIEDINEMGAYYILTNAAHNWVKETFFKKDSNLIELSRACLIGGKNAPRGNYGEFIFTNINLK